MRTKRACQGIAAIAAAVALLAPAGASATTETFTTVATPQNWTSPTDITSASVALNGGAGGATFFGPAGGRGGSTLATLTINPSTTYQLEVGAPGAAGTTGAGGAGGAPGGASGAHGCDMGAPPNCSSSGGGGGASIFALAGGVTSTAQWLAAAGGGGGGGTQGAGGNGGGLTGADGFVMGCVGTGEGGDQTGLQGSGNHINGQAGSAPSLGISSGGGGGGYYGGGAGNCGGGGGSGFVTPSAGTPTFPTPTATGAGSIAITYFTLTVSVSGDGFVSGPGISCGGVLTDCTQSFAPGDQFTLDASALTNGEEATFSGLGCSTSPCTTSLSADGTLSVTFAPPGGSPPPPPAVPETTITSAPPAKTKHKGVSFSFESSVAGSTFLCSVDASTFAACGSPDPVTAGKGFHTFAVQAIGPDGTPDATPANASWTVKKKKKHRHHGHHHHR